MLKQAATNAISPQLWDRRCLQRVNATDKALCVMTHAGCLNLVPGWVVIVMATPT